ncbi:hypothetical protein HZS_2207 [Henneguya salminicola]|nr:hypothetical protein HZS_2207 [Henneguya salminicola]
MHIIVAMNFEKALISAVNHEFPESRVMGCYFHFKQALHRKLKKYRVSSTNSAIILSKMDGVFRPIIKYGEALLEEFNICLLNN